MKLQTLVWMAITLSFPLAAPAAETGHHGHAAATHQQVTLNAGQKWHTDKPLRNGMSAIKGQVAAALPAAHEGKFSPAQYDSLGKNINMHVADIVRNCKLEPEADAQLHIVLGELTAGVEALEGKQGKEREAGLIKTAQALNTYGKYFDHPGWKPVSLPQ